MKTVLFGDFEPMAYKVIQAVELEFRNVKDTIPPTLGFVYWNNISPLLTVTFIFTIHKEI